MHVWMVDIAGDELSLAQRAVKSRATALDKGQMVLGEVLDVSDEKLMSGLAEQVFEAVGKCNVLFNNAGIGGTGSGAIATGSIGPFQRVMAINTYGPIYGCLYFVPKMKESGEPGLIINTGSKQGITCPPGNLPYNMSKAALKVYTEGLEHELRAERLDGSGGCKLRAALLIPGWTNTNIQLKSDREKAAEAASKSSEQNEFDPSSTFFHEDKPHAGAWMPKQVVDFMIKELDKGRFYILCPDNEVDRSTDEKRILWSALDITENRPPLSRWHPGYKELFDTFLKKKE